MQSTFKTFVCFGKLATRLAALLSALAAGVFLPAAAYSKELTYKAEHESKTNTRFNKKGIGLVESGGLGAKQLQALNVAWFYNWGASTKIKTDVSFVPMVFSPGSLEKMGPAHFDAVLGFNEPDNLKQSNVSVEEALRAWPPLVAKAKIIGSPAMAGNPITGSWLPAFMKANPKVDFVAVHWYKGANAKKFIRDIQDICKAYGKPVWVTEFAPSTAANGRSQPEKYDQSEVTQFINETVTWMNQEPCVERFAWHDAKEGTSALFDKDGNLTVSGNAYSQAQ